MHRQTEMRAASTDVSFLIPAAGCGERLGLGSKGFLELQGRPLLRWIADKALQVADEVLVAVPADRAEMAAKLLPDCRVIVGGASRQDSIALLAGQAKGDWLLVHDGARPFASVSLFEQVIAVARQRRCAGAFLFPPVPVARMQDGRIVEAHAGSEFGIFQTPQVYSRADMARIVRHHGTLPDWFAQSAVQLALAAGIEVHVVPGEISNIKITTPEDWRLAQSLESYLA